MMHGHRLIRCCFCNQLEAFVKSHNPMPVDKNPNARCCSDCNLEIVIPARLGDNYPKALVTPKKS